MKFNLKRQRAGGSSMPRLIVGMGALLLSTLAFAADGGPDYWRVHGIESGEELNMRRGPSVQFSIAAKLPHDTGQLLNLGCYPEMSQLEWESLSKKERKLAIGMKWCRVMHQGQTGWVYARYLKED